MPIIRHQPDTMYHADPHIGSTDAKLWLDSPQLFADQRNGLRQKKDTAALSFGRHAHMFFTDNAQFCARASEGPINEKTGKPYGQDSKAFAEWQAANPDAMVVPAQDAETLALMRSRMPSVVRSIFDQPADAEASVYQHIAGVAVKCRPDWWTGSCLYDLKTIGNIADAEKHISRYRYWFSHAWYRMIVKAETGKSLPFRFIFAEKNPPYRWRIVDIDADWIGYADATVDRVLGEIAEAQRTGIYADNGEVELMVSRPAWESDDDETEDGE